MPADSTIRDRAYFALRFGTRRWGQATAGLRAEPDFLIVGAQRCGTTSLFKTLSQHPSVVPAVLHKGVHYFDTNYWRGPEWYRGHFPMRRTLSSHDPQAGRAITGESSPYYLFHPHAAARIAKDLPEVRILALLRDPIERAHSAHSHEKARGYEDLGFSEAIRREEERTAAEYSRMVRDPDYLSFEVQHHAYVARGRYVDQLARMADAVGRDRILALDSGPFFARPEDVMPSVLSFLGLPRFAGFTYERHNARARTQMPAELRAQLEQEFKDDGEALVAWLGSRPSWAE